MLHDAVLSRSLGAPDGFERRTLPRTSFGAELVLIWHHDPQTPIRYQVIDAHENGVRIRTTVPMIEGMVGRALKMIPEVRSVERSVMVVWVGPRNASGEHEAGLRYF